MLNMLSSLRFSGFGRKGQFFIISIIIIFISLMGISTMIDAYGDIGLVDVHMYQEDGILRNVVEGIEKTAEQSECGPNEQPRKRNLKEFEKYARDDILFRDMYLDVEYVEFCPNLIAYVELESSDFFLNKTVSV